MRIKIYSLHHERPLYGPVGDIFMPIWTGGEQSTDGSWLTDIGSDNLHINYSLNEMRQEYFVWRNLLDSVDYVGFEHYRRLFMINPYSGAYTNENYPLFHSVYSKTLRDVGIWPTVVSPEEFVEYIRLRDSFSIEQFERIKEWVTKFDIIAPRNYYWHPIDLQWEVCGYPAASWDKIAAIIRGASYFKDKPCFVESKQVGSYFCNMHIMRREHFADFMELWWEVLHGLGSLVHSSPRMLGYISERVFSLWLLHKKISDPLISFTEVPFLFGDNNDEINAMLTHNNGISTDISCCSTESLD